MCFSADVSFTAAGVLIPAGALAINAARRRNARYIAFAALPLLFGFQQFSEGLVWLAAMHGADWIQAFSLAYMFFSWFAWPVWVPFSVYFVEPCRRRHLFLAFAMFGGMLGGLQFVPYFAHEGWLVVRVMERGISYEGTVLLDFIMRREITYALYLVLILAPLLTSSVKEVKIFGMLVIFVLAITYLFFRYAYISVFCFGGGVMSIYIVYVVFALPMDGQFLRGQDCGHASRRIRSAVDPRQCQ